jgi:hypothetical protein
VEPNLSSRSWRDHGPVGKLWLIIACAGIVRCFAFLFWLDVGIWNKTPGIGGVVESLTAAAVAAGYVMLVVGVARFRPWAWHVATALNALGVAWAVHALLQSSGNSTALFWGVLSALFTHYFWKNRALAVRAVPMPGPVEVETTPAAGHRDTSLAEG